MLNSMSSAVLSEKRSAKNSKFLVFLSFRFRTSVTSIRAFTDLCGFSNAQMDTWPQGVAHLYAEDAKRIIFTTVTEKWDVYFTVPDDMDDTILSEILFPEFFE